MQSVYGFVDLFFLPMGTKCASLPADLFLYSNEADFIQGLLYKNRKEASPII